MMRQGGGVVVNTSSGAGIRGVAGGASYAASKHGMIGMTKSAALDYAKKNVRVNCVLPGNIATPMMDRFTGGDIQKTIDLEPVGRLGRPEEIAEAVLWMCSDLGGFVTGASIVVDGGWSLQKPAAMKPSRSRERQMSMCIFRIAAAVALTLSTYGTSHVTRAHSDFL